MIFGLPFATFFWVIIVWVIALIAGVIYALTYKESDEWLTIEDIVEKRLKKREGRK